MEHDVNFKSVCESLKKAGAQDSKLLEAVDALLGLTMVCAPVALGPPAIGLLSILTAKNELSKIGRLVLSAATKKQGDDYIARMEIMRTAHGLLVYTAFFEALDTAIPDDLRQRLVLSAEERRVLANKVTQSEADPPQAGPHVSPTVVAESNPLAEVPILFPHPTQSIQEQTEAHQKVWEQLADGFWRFLQMLAVWDELEGSQREKLREIVDGVPMRAASTFLAQYVELLRKFPEFAIWANLHQHATTHAKVTGIEAKLTAVGAQIESLRAAPPVSAGATRGFDSWIVDLASVLEGIDLVRALKGESSERSLSDIKKDIEKRRQARVLIAKDEATLWKKIGALSFQSSPSEALSAYQQAVELDASDSAAWRGKALSLNRLGRTEEALEATVKALDLSPDDASCWSTHAYILGSLGKHEDALRAYERALALRPNNVADWTNRGFEFAQLGQVQKALEAFDRAIELDPRHASAWTNKGWALGEVGKLDEALVAHQKAVDLDPRFAVAWANLGSAFDRTGRFDDALAAWAESIKLNPSDTHVWVDKAMRLRNLNRLSEAEVAIERAITLGPEDAAAWNEKSLILATQGWLDEAVEAGGRGVALDPKNAVAWFNLGTTLARLRQNEKAAEAFERSVNCDGNDADAWYRLGNVLGRLGRLDESLEKLNRATELAPDSSGAWADRGRVLADLGRIDEALESLDRAAALSTTDATVQRDKGAILAELRRFEEALAALAEANKLNPKDAKVWLSTGIILGDIGRFGDAAKLLKVAVQLSPDDPDVWHQLGRALGAEGAFAEALVAQDKALDLDPDFAGAWNARGHALASLGNLQDASHSFVRAIVITPIIADTWLDRAREHVAARRWFAHLLVVGQVVASHKRDITTVEKLGEILQAWTDEFSDDPVVQGELVFGLYESMLAPKASDFDRAAPYFDRVNRALRRSAMDSIHMIELGVRILNMTEDPELVNLQRCLIALLTNYWPGFTPNSSSPTPLEISYAIRSMDGDAAVVYDSRDTVAKAQSIRQSLESRASNGELPDAAQLAELWKLRMHLEDRGDSLLAELQASDLSELIKQYHQDPWRGEAATWPMCNHEGGAIEAARQQPKSPEGGQ